MLSYLVPLLVLASVLFGILFATSKRKKHQTYKYAIGVAILAALLLFWVTGAVGIIGSEDNDANLMYHGILGIGLIGAVISRFRPEGMALAMTVTAGAQFIVFVVAWAAGWAFTGPITVFFMVLWLRSEWLFRQVEADHASANE